ncbi:hypothetical protein [Variovorax sp. HW608]|uniref:hypothetical protein n=1 Tax=Variovorax sp. HW608 TaxID=1034889 RepID=UPI0012FDF556|nr:hypothetical protein [Variovorax sp. HW608]
MLEPQRVEDASILMSGVKSARRNRQRTQAAGPDVPTAARAMGVAILTKTRAGGGGEKMPAVADASGPGRWVLWIGDVAVDDEAAQDDHRRIMQAVLVDALRSA